MPQDPDYLEALGRAIYRWAMMEWAIIYLAEELHPEAGTVQHSATMTSDEVTKHFRSALSATKISESTLADTREILYEYDTLVPQRNDIVHAHPATVSGQQRLHRVRADGTRQVIELDDLLAFSSDCARVGNKASALLWELRQGEKS
jgi:hypothetical protein